MIKAVAIDDEPVALSILLQHAAKIPFMHPLQIFASAMDALAYIKKEEVELIFLDINMPDISGIEFATLVDKQTAIIFTTAYPEFAVKGFELAAVDYLLKPINFSRFLTACQRVQDRLENNKHDKEYFFVKDSYEWIKIDFATILFAEADSNYITIYKTMGKTITRITLTELAEKLPADNFIRINKSIIIAVDKIEKVEKNYVVIGGKEIRISENYRDGFFKKIM
jgi:two-component system LytT family response regulator